ncbi:MULTISPECIES: metal-dependent hydrolase [Amycolatopsis]|uniref:Metal-dependent hydrolase n=1 Tax=Amycolatopsis dendrobii TaxID=2760662 RepID=A0A7W3VZX8_9PSEU|nr:MULTISPECIES: metal-dependent hydrolase [Amycolatopsis]MBB1155827.1 metal-dependent hydrolase [Amycolatopsis dendrobii]UKD53029.1 metal-dependent hydrolase [Amycolatopsis sp. FU40]
MSADHEQIVLHARDVEFDWSKLPMHWIPGQPQATHSINVLHLALPEGERWFVEVFKQAVPLIRDERLKEDVLGFIGQEAMHAVAHDGAAEHLESAGVSVRPYIAQMEWMFRRLLGDRPGSSREWLIERLALVAAIEHYTAFLGQWILDAKELDAAGADETMLDLLRWHGAEEVEHRSVAYDLFCHLDGRYGRRVRSMLVVTPVLAWIFLRGTRFLMKNDPTRPGRTSWRAYRRAARQGLLPGPRELLREIRPYFRKSYHPTETGNTDQAVAYLASSPAAKAADAPR